MNKNLELKYFITKNKKGESGGILKYFDFDRIASLPSGNRFFLAVEMAQKYPMVILSSFFYKLRITDQKVKFDLVKIISKKVPFERVELSFKYFNLSEENENKIRELYGGEKYDEFGPIPVLTKKNIVKKTIKEHPMLLTGSFFYKLRITDQKDKFNLIESIIDTTPFQLMKNSFRYLNLSKINEDKIKNIYKKDNLNT